ncbi:nitrogenase [Candidatus Gracilibacteria bacterium]|jgi:tellurite resistance protein|nr:nitrogenase [Candidatus Gracilibacteria bacterium]
MINTTQSPHTNEQITAWLRGLLTIAWADGHYDDEERALIAELTKELALSDTEVLFKSIEPEELAAALGPNKKIAENFLRTAVLAAIADGIYSAPEAELLHRFSDALGLKIKALQALEHTLCKTVKTTSPGAEATTAIVSPPTPHPDLLHPLKDWLDGMEMQDPRIARFICKMVPPQCPFERDVVLFGRKIIHIPPLCKLNPLYEQLVGMRFRALSYLADDCKEDISKYI